MRGSGKDERPQDPRPKLLKGLLCVFLGAACAMAFVTSPTGYVGMSGSPASSTSLLWSALAAVFAALFGYVWMYKGARLSAWHTAFGLLFGVGNYLGATMFAYDTWAFLDSPLAWGMAALRCVGQAAPMATAIALIDGQLQSGCLTKRKLGGMTRFPRLRGLYRDHTVLFCMALLVVCWSPYLIAYYPGTVSWDVGEMLAQFFGVRELDTRYPLFLTGVVGGLLWLGRLFGQDNFGLALFTLLQTAGLAYAFGYTIKSLRRMGADRPAQGAALCFFALTPLWGGYAQFICKDTLYTASLLLFTVHTLELLGGLRHANRWFLARYGMFTLLVCLLRNNGPYVVLPTAALAVIFCAGGKLRLRVGIALGSAALCVVLFSNALIPALGLQGGAESDLYSVCFQQSARALRDHGDEVTPEEYAGIDGTLDAASLPEKYEPWISDPVKYTFKPSGQSGEALAAYRTAWLSMLRKYPVTYLEALVAGNSAYYAFTPKMEGETYNNQAGSRLTFETHPQVATHLDVHAAPIPALEHVRALLAVFARGWRHIPLLSLLYSCAAYTWLLAAAGVSMTRQRRWRGLIAFVPAFLTWMMCALSMVNDYFRYFLPIVAMAVPLLVFADGNCRVNGDAEAVAGASEKLWEAEDPAAA